MFFSSSWTKQTLKIFLISLVILFATIQSVKATYATTATDFNPGKIIEDSVFTNSVSMTASDIQLFLNSKVPVCDTNGTQPSEYGGGTRAQWAANASLHPSMGAFYPPFTCLKDYSENGLSTAQIIFNISQQYQINPQVLIVLLQKEQALVTDTWPSPTQYKTATGYGCPDTAPCDSQYYGLTNQLTWSAKMFRAILNNSPTWYTPYSLGNNIIRWSPDSSCGGSTVFIENRSTQALYSYTPYQPNQAALNAGYGKGDNCSAYGNRNFYLYFRDWFGYNSGAAAFRVAGSSTIYIPVEGYKVIVPYMAVLQDYGISPESIQTVNQSYIDARPSPPPSTGISNAISYVVKSPYDTDEDGASVYLLSRGKRYQVQSMQQLYNMGFTDQDVTYLPLSYIYSKNNGGALSDFVSSPYGNVFRVDAQGKHLYFQYSTYINQNPSDRITSLSYYLTDKITSGAPIADKPILIKYSNSDAVNLYINGNYYAVPDYNTYTCWSLEGRYGIPVFRLPQNNYIAPIAFSSTLNCTTNDGTSNQILNSQNRLTIPAGYNITGVTVDSTLKAFQERLPVRSEVLKQYVKTTLSPAVWYIDSGKKRLVPTYDTMLQLGLSDDNIDIINSSSINAIPSSGIKLADGQIVKSPSDSAVFVIANNERVLYDSADLFIAYGNNWNSIETYTKDSLNQYYPYNSHIVSDVVVDKVAAKAYLISPSDCYVLRVDTLTAMGKDLTSLSATQPYDISVFKNLDLSSCNNSSLFLKQSGQDLVYWLDSGKKYPLYTYSAMLDKNNGTPPRVMGASKNFLSSITTGAGIY